MATHDVVADSEIRVQTCNHTSVNCLSDHGWDLPSSHRIRRVPQYRQMSRSGLTELAE